jgi:hypothetical protein
VRLPCRPPPAHAAPCPEQAFGPVSTREETARRGPFCGAPTNGARLFVCVWTSVAHHRRSGTSASLRKTCATFSPRLVRCARLPWTRARLRRDPRTAAPGPAHICAGTRAHNLRSP